MKKMNILLALILAATLIFGVKVACAASVQLGEMAAARTIAALGLD